MARMGMVNSRCSLVSDHIPGCIPACCETLKGKGWGRGVFDSHWLQYLVVCLQSGDDRSFGNVLGPVEPYEEKGHLDHISLSPNKGFS